MKLRLGLIGLSSGNGHPYSWAAIFNGYDAQYMSQCPFPAIPEYLSKQSFPADAIAEAEVTHIWTQDPDISLHIAKSSRIANVVTHYTEMIGQIDALLLARDDAETHLLFAEPFLNVGLPVYIDKPLALNLNEARHLFSLQKYPGQLFTCSAIRFAQEFQLNELDYEKIGEISRIHATSPKDWDKYAVHVIEPMLLILGNQGEVIWNRSWGDGIANTLLIRYQSGVEVMICTTGSSSSPISLRVMGNKGWKDMIFRDSFSAFREALKQFVLSILNHESSIAQAHTLEVINLIELGRSNEPS